MEIERIYYDYLLLCAWYTKGTIRVLQDTVGYRSKRYISIYIYYVGHEQDLTEHEQIKSLYIL